MTSRIKRKIGINEWVSLRLYVSEKDIHYAGGLVNGGFVISLFGDAVTLLLDMFDGDEGLIAAYKDIELLKSIHSGEFLEVKVKITQKGNTSRQINAEAWRIVKSLNLLEQPSAAEYLDQPEMVATAKIVAVVPNECQRYDD